MRLVDTGTSTGILKTGLAYRLGMLCSTATMELQTAEESDLLSRLLYEDEDSTGCKSPEPAAAAAVGGSTMLNCSFQNFEFQKPAEETQNQLSDAGVVSRGRLLVPLAPRLGQVPTALTGAL